MGAIASGGVRVLNREVLDYLPVNPRVMESVTARERQELERRERAFRGNKPPLDVKDKTVIVVDDGLATGSTMRAVVAALRTREPARIVVAVPTAPRSTCDDLRAEGDELVVVMMPEPFQAVGLWYEDFSPTTDEAVRDLLRSAALAQIQR